MSLTSSPGNVTKSLARTVEEVYAVTRTLVRYRSDTGSLTEPCLLLPSTTHLVGPSGRTFEGLLLGNLGFAAMLGALLYSIRRRFLSRENAIRVAPDTRRKLRNDMHLSSYKCSDKACRMPRYACLPSADKRNRFFVEDEALPVCPSLR
jgi:hypothetical protein